MSVTPQFLGMRVSHDDHRKRIGAGTVMGATWSDCDACLAIAAWDELMRQLEALTPGGSEFFHDPKRVLDYVRGRLAARDAWRLERARLRGAIRHFLESGDDLRTLRAALEGTASSTVDESVIVLSGLLQHHDALAHPPEDPDVMLESPTWCLVAEAARLYVQEHGVAQPKPERYGP